MKKFALGALLAGLAAACGSDGKNNNDTGNIITDMDVPQDGCSPLTQTGCSSGEKCTWIQDQEDPPIGHVGCAPEGSAIAIGEACTPNEAGPMGWDDCAKGSVCLSGVCKQICDNNGGQPACDSNHSCTIYADFFDSAGTTVAGVCDPGCDPLTQELKVAAGGGPTAACGSPMANMPNKGCYGFDDYSCAPAGPLTNVDRQPPRTNSAGNPYLNGCAPGYIVMFRESTGSNTTVCSGYCAAVEVNSGTTNATTLVKGNAQALGKLPTEAAARAGGATCDAASKGASQQFSECIFIWPYRIQDDGTLPAGFEAGPYPDTLGVCLQLDKYSYDKDGDPMGIPEEPYPSCSELPPRSAATTGDDDDNADWGCTTYTNAPMDFKSSAKSKQMKMFRDMRMPGAGAASMPLVRHSL